MTSEMFYIIIELALTKLIELPNSQLKSYEPWLKRKHIRYCLDHYKDFRLGPSDDTDKSTRVLIQEATKIFETLAKVK